MESKDRQTGSIEMTVPLVDGFHAFGSLQMEIVFYKPRAALLREIEANDAAGEQSLAIAANLADIPIELLDTMSLEDGFVVINAAGSIVKKSSVAARKRLRALGILPPLEEGEEDEEGEALGSETGSEEKPPDLR